MNVPRYIVAFFVLVLSYCAYMGIFQGFGAQCTKAGFTGAAHEACVMRVSKGGTVYPENMPKQP